MKKTALLIIVFSCLFGCGKNEEKSLDELVKYCWVKYGEESEGMMDDPKCSNFTVFGRIAEIGVNRKCGYPDLYRGERNLNDLSNLSKKDRKYVEQVLACAEKYIKYAAPGNTPNSYRESSLPQVFEKLKADRQCNMSVVKDRIGLLAMSRRYELIGDEGICRK